MTKMCHSVQEEQARTRRMRPAVRMVLIMMTMREETAMGDDVRSQQPVCAWGSPRDDAWREGCFTGGTTMIATTTAKQRQRSGTVRTCACARLQKGGAMNKCVGCFARKVYEFWTTAKIG